MHEIFKELLPESKGEAGWVVSLNVDVREFTAYTGPRMESLQAALFLKLVYEKMLSEYFSDSTFFKPTGDGLLVIFDHPEEALSETLGSAVEKSFRLIEDFPSFVVDNPMVNFDVPNKLGIGIAHGSASRLTSGNKTLDYFGTPVNLASRLMDFARPSGVVLDDTRPLAKELSRRFWPADIYVRGMAEAKPIRVYYWRKYTKIPPSAKIPLLDPKWESLPPRNMKMKKLKEYAASNTNLLWGLPVRPVGDEVDVKIHYPEASKTGHKLTTRLWRELRQEKEVNLIQDRGEWKVSIATSKVIKYMEDIRIRDQWEIRLNIAYPRPP